MHPSLSSTRTRAGAWPLTDLAAHGQRLALKSNAAELSYCDLAQRVEETVEFLGPARRLIMIAGSNHIEAIVTYLATLAGGHCALLVPGQHAAHLAATVEAYDPDLVLADQGDTWRLLERRADSAHDLHPDLALLLSTSGSTGSPKLVRLSHENLQSNADSIASYLGITSTDRAATSLPLHYCYGLSVVNSHLRSGAGVAVTDASVVDPCFWDLFESAEATTFAGVPYTFDLLDRSGFADRDLPRLRYITQAGGRLRPERVTHYSALGARRGWQLYVMYGQTEATARMAYLPPHLAGTHPAAIGVPIPGGSFRLEPTSATAEPDTGELVYSGPNVMMGYAETRADLSLGRTVHELHTGDVARRHPDGLYEIVARQSRFAKLFGLRIDLDELERFLDDRGCPSRCVSRQDTLFVFVTRHAHAGPAASAAAEHCSLPRRAVRAEQVAMVPTTSSGKPDYTALERQAAALQRQADDRVRPAAGAASAAALRDVYAELLGRPDATVDSSFVRLGGDSLSYVELSVRLGQLLGQLPRDWHRRPIRQLAGANTPPPRRGSSSIETSVLVRAAAIVLIVGTHANLFTVFGGAHCLLAVAGYTFARLHLGASCPASRIRNGVAAIVQIAVPSMVWIGLVAVAVGTYEIETTVFLNGLLGSDTWTLQWQFWFLEALLWTLVAVIALLSIPAVDTVERRAPFAFAVLILAAALAVRYLWVGIEAGPTERYTPAIVFWCFALGWATAVAAGRWHRLLLTGVIPVSVFGFFGDPQREAVVAAGLLLLVWLPGIRAPRAVGVAVGALASSSLYIYLTHWQVYPQLEVDHPLLAVACSIAAGLAYWWLARPVMRALGSLVRRRDSPTLRNPSARRVAPARADESSVPVEVHGISSPDPSP